ncbi:imidazole glycerol phosphate synthase subunit HisH [Paramagnetospirillum caucaseum]|uniref:Imidazole glycerol phosphate synthase subunit HisH n=1 Tax=Paramagnetospirillum caucaseum TaxID=1244869 RepID=M3A9W7_9PROT|nr:imidazole glycerol phosphate synthase subunit HisH [Paramagnetospirillum caucaseum]EME69304.1 imidazole glycerol phosphate synthase subunit HisH [Paramagnetospirillum caucaseum]
MTDARPTIAIIDCAHGNLFSIAQACQRVGLEPLVTHDAGAIADAGAVILPGVGAFGTAMEEIRARNLIAPIEKAAASGRPFVGICLGMQLLFEESREFGTHGGLGLLKGDVVRFDETREEGLRSKVPQVGWNRIRPSQGETWTGNLLDGIAPDSYVYFLHSFYVRPSDPQARLALTTYGGESYCSAVQHGNIAAFQFHPERSGPIGLAIFRNLAKLVSA